MSDGKKRRVWNPETNEYTTREELLRADYADYNYILPADPQGILIRIYHSLGEISRKDFETFVSKLVEILKRQYETVTTSSEIEEINGDLGFHDMLGAIGFHCPPGWPSGTGIRVESAPIHWKSPSGKVLAQYIWIDPCSALSTEIIEKIKNLNPTTEVFVLTAKRRASEDEARRR